MAKEAHLHPGFKNIEVYHLICHMLGVNPAPNDGDFSDVASMLFVTIKQSK